MNMLQEAYQVIFFLYLLNIKILNRIKELVKNFNSYYQSNSILKVESKLVRTFRLSLSYKIGLIIKSSMQLLGIDVPNKM